MSSKKKSGNLNYLYKNVQQTVKDSKSSTLEEMIIDGPKGLSIKYYSKLDNSIEKIVIFGKDNSYTMKIDNVENKLDKNELLEELKKNKKLKFASEYVKMQKGGSKNLDTNEYGVKKTSKKKSKKTSKKTSKKY